MVRIRRGGSAVDKIHQPVSDSKWSNGDIDKVINSQNSRYWGLLPEEYIVGKAVRIWKSVDKRTDRVRSE